MSDSEELHVSIPEKKPATPVPYNNCKCPKRDENSENENLFLVCTNEKRKVTLWEYLHTDKQDEEQEEEEEGTTCETHCSKDIEELFEGDPVHYLNKEVFQELLPAVVEMSRRANDWNLFENPKSRYNALDLLAEILWNKNSRHPNRFKNWLDVFDILPFKTWLRQHPRPIYPKSWIWTEDEGATIIQRWVRGWLLRKQNDVQEMRKFWKIMREENEFKKLQKDEDDMDFCQRIKQHASNVPVLF